MWDFENYKAELQITTGNKNTDAINKLNEAITVELENESRWDHSEFKEWGFVVTEPCR